MGTKSPIENKFLNYRAFQRKRVRKAKLARPSAERNTLAPRGSGGVRQKYAPPKQPKQKKRSALLIRHVKFAKEKERRLKQIAEAQAEGRLQNVTMPLSMIKAKKAKKEAREAAAKAAMGENNGENMGE